jgi:hypothetical protein
MPDAGQRVNAPHLKSRLGQRADDAARGIGQAERSAAIHLEGHIAAGDLGAVRRALNAMEHGLSPFEPDPWKLLEVLAGRAIGRRQEPAGATSPAAPNPEGAPADGH